MHEWHTNTSSNIQSLIDEFTGFKFDTGHSGRLEITRINITNKIFSTYEAALNYVTSSSYGGATAYLAAYTTKKLSKGYLNTFDNFLKRRNEYIDFRNQLTISYGRKALRVTCPNCQSSISLNYGKRFKACPVCGSSAIISDSNKKILETKRKLMKKAAEALSVEATKNNVTFICGIEWHC